MNLQLGHRQGRKHQKRVTDSTSVFDPSMDLKALIHDHARFLDKLIELIPAKFYLQNEHTEQRPWFPGLSKAQKSAAKKESREKAKKARRERLDPEISSKTTIDLLKQSLEDERSKEEDDGNGMEGEERAATYEELHNRLRIKIKGFRAARNGNNLNNNDKRDSQRKRNREDQDDPKLLNKRLKKEKRRRQKIAKKWKESVQSREKIKAEKQQKKKMKRIVDGEKKLMRPGFEGRKERFMGEASSV